MACSEIIIILLLIFVFFAISEKIPSHLENVENVKISDPQQRIARLLEYLSINTTQPNPNYRKAIKFLETEAGRIGLSSKIYEIHKGHPILVITWNSFPLASESILVNSHMDVVKADPQKWTSDPYKPILTQNGFVVGRGVQDMKSVGMQYLEAVDILKNQLRFNPRKNLLITFVPDEEIGGEQGMKALTSDPTISQELFKNVKFGLDEGLASPTDVFSVYYEERSPCWMNVSITGAVGHGSSFIENTATEKLSILVGRLYEFRESQMREMRLLRKKSGDVTSINWTAMQGGSFSAINVIPSTVTIGIDFRIPPTVKFEDFLTVFNSWITDLQPGVEYNWTPKFDTTENSNHFNHNSFNNIEFLDKPEENEHVKKLLDVFKRYEIKFELMIFPASTDARFLRDIGIPMIGFSPMNGTTILLHDHDERLHVDVYQRGIEIYTKILEALLL